MRLELLREEPRKTLHTVIEEIVAYTCWILEMGATREEIMRTQYIYGRTWCFLWISMKWQWGNSSSLCSRKDINLMLFQKRDWSIDKLWHSVFKYLPMDDHSFIEVDWNDAAAYAEWTGKQLSSPIASLPPSGFPLRSKMINRVIHNNTRYYFLYLS